MKRKKILGILAACLLTIGLAGCSTETNEPAKEAVETEPVEEKDPEEIRAEEIKALMESCPNPNDYFEGAKINFSKNDLNQVYYITGAKIEQFNQYISDVQDAGFNNVTSMSDDEYGKTIIASNESGSYSFMASYIYESSDATITFTENKESEY